MLGLISVSMLVGAALWIAECLRAAVASDGDKLSLPPSESLVIKAWGSPPAGPDVVQRYQEFAEAGFTHGMCGFSDPKQAGAILDAAGAAGVRMFPMLSHSPMKGPEVARLFAKHPALAGYFLQDEPSATDFPALTQLARDIMAIDADGAKVYLANLFPNYATNQQLGLAPHQKYYEHVHKFLSEVPVNVLSYDYYPINRSWIDPRWYENMQIMLDAAQMAKMLWWAYIASVGFHMYPEPSLGSLRLTSYTNLAYGATGIEHWFYWYYREHRGSAIEADGSRGATWGYDKQVNAELRAQSGVFVGSTVKRVRYVGPAIPEQVKPYEPRGGITSVEAGGKGAIVSELWKGDYRFLLIVNQDYLQPIPVKVEWKAPMRVGSVGKDGSVTMLDKPYHADLGPGDAAILMWLSTAGG